MPKTSVIPETISVDDTDYVWQVRHSWGVDWGVGVRGVSVSVWLHPGHTRELIVDFPFATFGVHQPPRKALLPHLASSICAALIAGWVPDSRGKPFRFEATNVA